MALWVLALTSTAAAANQTSGVVQGRAIGLRGPVTLQVKGGPATIVVGDGPFVLPVPLSQDNSLRIEILAAPAGLTCSVKSSTPFVAAANTEVLLRCAATVLAAKPMLPAENAANVNPLLGKVVLVVTEMMAEAPTATFKLEARDGEKWIDTGLGATAEYKADTREWWFNLEARMFPPKRVLRVTIVPTSGKNATGKALPRTPVQWSFTTGVNPLVTGGEAKLKGGCPVDVAPPAATP